MYKTTELFADYKNLTTEKIDEAIAEATSRIKHFIPFFEKGFPGESSVDNVYSHTGHHSWVEGFYTGVLWLCYELTGDAEFKIAAEKASEYFYYRLENNIGMKTHDLGFLYTLSCVAQYKVTGDKKARDAAVLAADNLAVRFREKGQFIQAWGELDAHDNYRLIIDCLLNIPLLFWASEETGDNKYRHIAETHLNTTLSVIAREDGSTHHTYFFDLETGAPLYGKQHQGYNDDSTWARGQSWAVLGTAIAYSYMNDSRLLPLWGKFVDYYLDNLPDDKIAYWDLCFKEGNEQPRDASSNAIVICGILEADKLGVCDEKYICAAKSMLATLIDQCTTKDIPDSNGLLTKCTYHWDDGANECCPWGDYYYLEALTRLKKDWKMYW